MEAPGLTESEAPAADDVLESLAIAGCAADFAAWNAASKPLEHLKGLEFYLQCRVFAAAYEQPTR